MAYFIHIFYLDRLVRLDRRDRPPTGAPGNFGSGLGGGFGVGGGFGFGFGSFGFVIAPLPRLVCLAILYIYIKYGRIRKVFKS